MIIESDLLYAYIKESDWLKPVALSVMDMISRGELGEVKASREVLHEIYYVSIEEGISLNEVINRLAHLTAIDNLTFVETTWEDDLLALSLMAQYGLTSIFDAYYAALALRSEEPIVSTDHIYDRVAGLRRVDPRDLIRK